MVMDNKKKKHNLTEGATNINAHQFIEREAQAQRSYKSIFRKRSENSQKRCWRMQGQK